MNHSFNNDSLDSGTSHDYTGGHSSDLGYNQHDNLNSDQHWQDLSQQHLDQHHGWGLPDGSQHDRSEISGLPDLHQNPPHQPFDSGLANDNFYRHSHHSEISGLTDLGQNEPHQPFDSPFDNSDRSLGDDGTNSYYHQPHGEYSLGNDSYSELPQLGHDTGFGSQTLSMNSSPSCSTYTTINNYGFVYQHHSKYDTGSKIGTVEKRCVYNTSHHYVGYTTTDGKIYDSQKHCVGWTDHCGRVYNSSGVHIYDSTRGIIDGAAYVLLVYSGGVD